MHCPDKEVLQDLVDGDLPKEKISEVMEHIKSCNGCKKEVQQMLKLCEALGQVVSEDLCPSIEILEGYARNPLVVKDADKIKEHIEFCERCQSYVRLFQASPAELAQWEVEEQLEFQKYEAQRIAHEHEVAKSTQGKLLPAKSEFFTKVWESVLTLMKEKLDPFDFASLCTRLLEISKNIIKGLDREAVDFMIGDILTKLGPTFSQAVIRTRGESKADLRNLTQLSDKEMTKLGRQLEATVKQHLMLSSLQHQQKPLWSGSPELWIFSHLTESMKKRAVYTRDWCEEKLERINFMPDLQLLPSVGVGHAKRVLSFAVELLKAFEERICNPLTCFAIYAGAYCQHLGLLLLEEHQARKEKELIEFWKDHQLKTLDMIIGNTNLSIAASWPAMGFLSEQEAMLVVNVCTGEQRISKKTITKLPTSQSIFLEGQSMNVQPLAAFAILRLATTLDCSQERLPRLLSLREPKIPEDLIYEFLKHEVVRDVNIDKDGTIHIKMRACYRYPSKIGDVLELVRRKLQQQIKQDQELLRQNGASLPDPEFDCGEALFLQEHPYLGE